MELDIFLGRFHPLLVHLPIGMFILGYLFEILFQLGYKRFISSRKTIVSTYCISFIFGVLAALTGWLLSFSNDYGFKALNNHKVIGILTLVAMLVLIIFQVKATLSNARWKIVASTFVLIFIALTGHLGGNLTHGSDYLTEYGPEMIRSNDTKIDFNNLPIDSINVYTTILKPAIEEKCYACHNSENFSGGLNLEKFGNLFKDANHNLPIVAGDPYKSEFFKRISLPIKHEKFMPPREKGFSYTEIQVLKYWIENGADSLTVFDSKKMNEELIELVKRDYELDFKVKPYYETINTSKLDTLLLNELIAADFRVNYLGQDNFLLDVHYKGDSIADSHIHLLNKISEHITFLKMEDCKLSNKLVNDLKVFPHLTRVDFSKNDLDSSIVDFLKKHQTLESINLNYTSLDKDAIDGLLELKKLSRIYVWNTEITEEDINNLSKKNSEIEIISGFQFDEVEKPKSVFELRKEQ